MEAWIRELQELPCYSATLLLLFNDEGGVLLSCHDDVSRDYSISSSER